MAEKKLTVKERVAILETKVQEAIVKIDNHCRAHFIDRVVQAVTLSGMGVIIFLLKVFVLK